MVADDGVIGLDRVDRFQHPVKKQVFELLPVHRVVAEQQQRVGRVFDRAEVLYKKNADGYKKINMQRFIDTDMSASVRSDIKKALKTRNTCVEYVLEAMKRASEHHFALEKIYGDAMDFSAKEEFTDNFIGELFDTK